MIISTRSKFLSEIYNGATVALAPARPAMRENGKVSAPARALSLFFVYVEEDLAAAEELQKHLTQLQRQGVVSVWYKQKIAPGEDIQRALYEHIRSAHIILLIVSPDFLASDYCADGELAKVLMQQSTGQAMVIPILARPADWPTAWFGRLQPLPRIGTPISLWSDRDVAWLNIVQELRTRIASLFPAQQYLPQLNGIELVQSEVPTIYIRLNPHDQQTIASSQAVLPNSQSPLAVRWVAVSAILLGLVALLAVLQHWRNEPEAEPTIVVESLPLDPAGNLDRAPNIPFDSPEQFVVKVKKAGRARVVYKVFIEQDEAQDPWRVVRALLKQNNELIAEMRYLQSQVAEWRREQRPQLQLLVQLDGSIKTRLVTHGQSDIKATQAIKLAAANPDLQEAISPSSRAEYEGSSLPLESAPLVETPPLLVEQPPVQSTSLGLPHASSSTVKPRPVTSPDNLSVRKPMALISAPNTPTMPVNQAEDINKLADCAVVRDCGKWNDPSCISIVHPLLTRTAYESCQLKKVCNINLNTSCLELNYGQNSLFTGSCLSPRLAQQICNSLARREAEVCKVKSGNKVLKLWQCTNYYSEN